MNKQCSQCHAWSPDEALQCTKCGTKAPTQPTDAANHSNRTSNEESPDGASKPVISQSDGDEEEGEVDEFGRTTHRPRSTTRQRQKDDVEWPPLFDEQASDFVFDSRSGMFYESQSEFFYDPKTKLYYGNKQGAYFKYNPETKSFDTVAQVAAGSKQDTTTDLDPLLDHTGRPQSADGGTNRKSILINLKTKSLKKVKKKKPQEKPQSVSAAPAASDATNRLQKAHAADIEKWSVRQNEGKPPQEAEVTTKQEEEVLDEKTIKKTDKGEPICALCRRKFPTVDKLRYHVKASKLHKDNLAKRAAQSQSKSPPTTTAPAPKTEPVQKYVDRAQQRRNMYGPDMGALTTGLVTAELSPRPVSSTMATSTTATSAPVVSNEPLGDHNVGHQMLKKLGWKGTSTLSAQTSDDATATQDSLKRDWDRIEQIAAKRQRHGN